MRTTQEISQQLKEHSLLLSQHHVESLWLFGSIARGGDYPNDLDLLVEFRSAPSLVEFLNLKEQLTEILGMPVDLVSRKGCRTQFLKSIEPDLLHVA